MNCNICGAEITDTSLANCPYCGNILQHNNVGPSVFTPATQSKASRDRQERLEKEKQRNKTILIAGIAVAVVLLIIVAIVVLVVVAKKQGKWFFSDNAGVYDEYDDENSYDEFEGEEATNGEDNEDSSPDLVYMPDCTGKPIENVYNIFSEDEYDITVTYESSATISENCVISQSVSPGSEIPYDKRISFVVSNGNVACPEEYSQKLVLEAGSTNTSATLTLYKWDNGTWISQYSCVASVGRNGIGYNYGEGKGVTPAGTFKLGVVLSPYHISNDSWPYQTVTTNTCIVDDTTSTYYNTIKNISNLPSGVHYDNIGETIVNGNTSQCMYVEHNGDGLTSDGVVPGAGSGITICGKSSALYETAGCIDVSENDFNAILNLLEYSRNPHIEIKP